MSKADNNSVPLLAGLKNAYMRNDKQNINSNYEQLESVLEQAPMGAGILDRHGRIIDLNQQANQTIKKSSLWSTEKGLLHANHLNFRGKLRMLKRTGESFISVPFTLEDTSQRVYILPLQLISIDAGYYYYFCLHTEKQTYVNEQTLREFYRLTDIEVLVTATLLQEVSSKVSTHELKLSEKVISEHLSSILYKFNVEKVSELIRKILLHNMLFHSDKPCLIP